MHSVLEETDDGGLGLLSSQALSSTQSAGYKILKPNSHSISFRQGSPTIQLRIGAVATHDTPHVP